MDHDRERQHRRSRSRSRERRRHRSSHGDDARRRSRSRSRSRERRRDRKRSVSRERDAVKERDVQRRDGTASLASSHVGSLPISDAPSASVLHSTDLYAVRDELSSAAALPTSAAPEGGASPLETAASGMAERGRSKWDDEPQGAAGAAPAAEAPNFGLSGALAADVATGNVLNGITLKFCEPPEARVPSWKWHFRIFKGERLFLCC